MKQKFLSFCMAALMLVGLVGCQQPEQSELEFANLQDTAYVIGCVTYSLGQDTLSSDYLAEVVKPAVGRTVYIDVPLSSYTAGAQGNKMFTGVVDSLGNVKIAVPVKSDGIAGATLRYEEFTAERAEYLKMENGKPVFEVRMNKFETPAAIAALPTLMPGSNKIGEIEEMRYANTVIDMKDYAEKAILTGKLRLPYEVSYQTGAYKDAANCHVEFTIKDGEDVKDGKNIEYTYGCVTNEEGEFALTLPIKNMRAGFHIVDAKVVPVADAEFVHYTDLKGNSVKVAGAYKLRTNWETGSNILDVAEVLDGVNCSIGVCPLEFIPGYNNGITDPVTPVAWQRNLAGWVFGEKQFAHMTSTAKISGAVKLAAETAYGVGTYTTSVQVVTIQGTATPYDSEFTVVTAANGKFELEIPVEIEGAKPATTWSVDLVQPNTIAYKHHTSATTSLTLKEGTYQHYKEVRGLEANWNELGDQYYTFAPATTLDTWVEDLAGWVVKDNYEKTTTITAKLYVAQEKQYAEGEYKGAAGELARVTVVYPEGNETFVAPVQADGTVTWTVPAKDANSVYTADAIELVETEVDDFVHYTKTATKKLAGQYGEKYKFETKDAEWNNKWTIYYGFTPSATVDTYHADLAGWFKKDGFEKSATAKGKAYFAKEKSYAIGEYAPAANEVVTVTVAYLDGSANLQVPVKTDGSFTVAIPVKDTHDEFELSVSAGSVEVDDFVHYKDHGKTQTLAGTYQPQSPIKSEDAAWNELGTYYFKFQPSATVATYTNKLYGWQKYDEEKYSNKEVEITGTIKIATETDFWAGTYEPYAKKRVLVQYTLGTTNFEFIVLTDADGVFACQAYREFNDETPAVSASLFDSEVNNFVHYYHASSPKTMKVEGEYVAYVTDKAASAAWNNVGTKYYKFNPDVTPQDWPSNTLVGWYVVPQKQATAQIKLYAQKAIESTTSGSHDAQWANADKVKARVTVNGTVFNMLVKSKNLHFSYPMSEKIEDGVTMIAVSVHLEEEDAKFTHYPDPAEDKKETLTGSYKSADNVNSVVITAEGTKFEHKVSAKMLFFENGYTLPSGYTWDLTAEHDA